MRIRAFAGVSEGLTAFNRILLFLRIFSKFSVGLWAFPRVSLGLKVFPRVGFGDLPKVSLPHGSGGYLPCIRTFPGDLRAQCHAQSVSEA